MCIFCTPPPSALLLVHFCCLAAIFAHLSQVWGLKFSNPLGLAAGFAQGRSPCFGLPRKGTSLAFHFFLCPHQTAQIRLLGRIFSLFQSRFDEGKFENLSCHWLRERGAALGGVGGRKPRIAVGGLLCRTPHRFTQVTTFSGFTFFLTENMCLFLIQFVDRSLKEKCCIIPIPPTFHCSFTLFKWTGVGWSGPYPWGSSR